MEINDKLRDILLEKMPMCSLASAGRLVVFRCPFCGDSHNPTSKHFYVNLGYNDEPFMYYCHKCKISGILNNNLLMSWGIYDVDLCVSVTKYNSQLKFTRHQDNYIYKLNNNYIEDNKLNNLKLKYINDRLKVNLSFKDLIDLKIVLSIYDLFKCNYINSYTRSYNIMDELNKYFIGFISRDNAFINMRNLSMKSTSEKLKKRYINYNIFNKSSSKNNYYFIPTTIDLDNIEKVKINISEGPFDILSVYLNLRNKEKHSIYCAIGGSNYLNIIKYILTDVGLYNSEIHLYIDNDIMPDIYIIYNILNIYNIPLYIHKNICEGEKDFGVSKDRIIEVVNKIDYSYFNI